MNPETEFREGLDELAEHYHKILGLLGIAAKAGKLASGEFAAVQALSARKAWLTIVAEDASANTKKQFRI